MMTLMENTYPSLDEQEPGPERSHMTVAASRDVFKGRHSQLDGLLRLVTMTSGSRPSSAGTTIASTIANLYFRASYDFILMTTLRPSS
jgi:hypothetical protein